MSVHREFKLQLGNRPAIPRAQESSNETRSGTESPSSSVPTADPRANDGVPEGDLIGLVNWNDSPAPVSPRIQAPREASGSIKSNGDEPPSFPAQNSSSETTRTKENSPAQLSTFKSALNITPANDSSQWPSPPPPLKRSAEQIINRPAPNSAAPAHSTFSQINRPQPMPPPRPASMTSPAQAPVTRAEFQRELAALRRLMETRK